MHFVFSGIAYFFKDDVKIERVYDHGRRLVFYGIAGIFLVYQSNFEYEFSAVWNLSRSLCLGIADFKFCVAQYGTDEISERKLSKYRCGSLLPRYSHMVLWDNLLLHVQCL